MFVVSAESKKTKVIEFESYLVYYSLSLRLKLIGLLHTKMLRLLLKIPPLVIFFLIPLEVSGLLLDLELIRGMSNILRSLRDRIPQLEEVM